MYGNGREAGLDVFVERPARHQEAKSSDSCVGAIATSIDSGNEFVKDRAKNFLTNSATKEWVKLFAKYLERLTDQEKPEIYLPENGLNSRRNIPFLRKFKPRPNPGLERTKRELEHMDDNDVPF